MHNYIKQALLTLLQNKSILLVQVTNKCKLEAYSHGKKQKMTEIRRSETKKMYIICSQPNLKNKMIKMKMKTGLQFDFKCKLCDKIRMNLFTLNFQEQ